MTTSKKPRVAVIGYGFAGRSFHSYLVGLTPGLELAGVASGDPAKRAKVEQERGCRAYASVDEVLADSAVDAVVLATPTASHAPLAVAALEAGKHVVTDKPMALSLEEVDRMIAAAEASGRLLTVFQNRRWDGDYLTLRSLMDGGRLERVRRIEMAWSGMRVWGGWRGQAAAGGGKVYDLGAHMIDQMLLLFPQPVTSVYARLQYESEKDVETDALLVLGFEDGATGVIEASSISAIAKPRFYATGWGGTFVKHGLDPQEAWMKAGAIDGATEDPAKYGQLNTTGQSADTQTVQTLPGRWRSFYDNLAEALTGEAEPAVTAGSVRRQIAVIEAAFASHRAGQAVTTRI